MREEVNETIGDIVRSLNRHTIVEYEPHEVVLDIVKNFWFVRFKELLTDRQLWEMPMEIIEIKTKELYLKSFPDADEETLENFAANVVFHIAFKLSKQGKNVDKVVRG